MYPPASNSYERIVVCSLIVASVLAGGISAAAEASLPMGLKSPALADPQNLVSNSKRMKLISRGLPAFASSGNARAANSGEYRSGWRSSGVPATLTYDLASVPAANRQSIYLVWYNDATYPYDHGMGGGPGYNNVGAYTIEANSAPGGGQPPESGWRTLESVANNTLHSRDHIVNFAGFNWLRLNATATDGTTQNYDVSIDLDVYDASSGVNDGWFFFGDSITANCMGHWTTSESENFINQIGAKTGVYPAEQNAGMPGWNVADGLKHLSAMLSQFHGRYVTVALGTNDAAGNANPDGFYSGLVKLTAEILEMGKVPVVPTIPWSREPIHAKNISGLNDAIRKLYKKQPRVLPGADLYDLFSSHPEYISQDNLHPTKEGCLAMRSRWADAAIASVYAIE
jgi:lysophospholipase L1-like esterase